MYVRSSFDVCPFILQAEFHWDRFKDRLAGRESALLPGEVRKAVSFFLEGDKMVSCDIPSLIIHRLIYVIFVAMLLFLNYQW